MISSLDALQGQITVKLNDQDPVKTSAALVTDPNIYIV